MFVQSEAYIYEDDKKVVLCSFNYGLGNIQLNLTARNLTARWQDSLNYSTPLNDLLLLLLLIKVFFVFFL